ncbi:rubredoxin [Flagellimonas zhangzhouensis]|uniref:Rubredoxin n=1 Tax=Flagellimonas zhangzhouensis TaxID=1073328 RepID=A0A1H2YKT6_9FLAO|nr:rubredoxin [Allomuricauda zhangzhouensis]SDR02266.1 Rubredoxin [Allomuricauda zhangzhouensis]SDX05615.1 Rubredoxin [Allomuricauda zhangzhouensis]
MNDDLNRIFVKGGVTSPGELMESIALLESAGLTEVYFGSRQDILCPTNNSNEQNPIDIVADRSFQNIVCSYVCADIFDATHWLKGSTYLYLLEQFDFLPKLKINITDPKQRLVPIFGGNLNFIASEHEDYWYLDILLPQWETSAYYPVLVYSWDIADISREIEKIYKEIQDVEELFAAVNSVLATPNNKAVDKELFIPYQTFPYYEGLNRMGIDQYWLGLYWRNNRYNLKFLKDFCSFCLDQSFGKICITPWKSLIVKGIPKECRTSLELFLGERGINVRHSQLEMNWHLPVDDSDALDLKRYLVQSFDQKDISTYGLTFGISNQVGKRTHMSSVVIEKNPISKAVEQINPNTRPTYNIRHFKNFNPNTQNLQTFAQDIDQRELPDLLIELSKLYFQELGKEKDVASDKSTKTEVIKNEVYQCQNCFTVYDDVIGDPKSNIASNTRFEELPETYECNVCGAGKSIFVVVELMVER